MAPEYTMAGKGFTRWHIVRSGPRSVCGSMTYTEAVQARNVPVAERCMNTACKGHWPDYRPTSENNTLMRFGSPASGSGGT